MMTAVTRASASAGRSSHAPSSTRFPAAQNAANVDTAMSGVAASGERSAPARPLIRALPT